ncbi:MAG TPA: hypothetical protein VGH21_05220, partial [Solirubrobacteraceae bacterium]
MSKIELRRGRPARYSTLQGFYAADPRRVRSRERDVGLWWRASADGPLHRAAWINDTGELYLVQLGDPEQGGGRVEVLSTVAEEDRLEQVLEGWRRRCGEPQSLAWLRGRVARLGGRVSQKRATVGAAM